MYSADVREAQFILSYSDVFPGGIPNLEDEIPKLNMHKAISIICELIRVRNAKLNPIRICGLEIIVPYETIIKTAICGLDLKSSEEMFNNPILRNNQHIISIQMLLLLLKKVIQYGDSGTLSNTDYEIKEEDYKKIIQLQLAVAERVSEMDASDPDTDYYLYATYHLNYQRNVANEFLRTYYMLEILDRDKNNFDSDVQNEYRDYYTAFQAHYDITPTQYIFLIFEELDAYFSGVNGLLFQSMWRDVESKYGHLKNSPLVKKTLGLVSRPVKDYQEWVTNTSDRRWDFSEFYAFPFMEDSNGKYISVSDVTLINAFFEKVFWMIRDCYPEDDSRAMSFYGRLFEKYIQKITEDVAGHDYIFIPEYTYGNKRKKRKSSDAYLRKENRLLAVEAKGFSVLLDCMTRNEKVDKNNTKLFINPVLQADKCMYETIDNMPKLSGVDEIFVVSVTMDNINAVPGYYNSIHNSIAQNKKCDKVRYFFNFSIEEYEMLLCLVESEEDIFPLLKEYFNNNLLLPFGNYILDRYPETRRTRFMEGIFKQATNKMKDFIFEA